MSARGELVDFSQPIFIKVLEGYRTGYLSAITLFGSVRARKATYYGRTSGKHPERIDPRLRIPMQGIGSPDFQHIHAVRTFEYGAKRFLRKVSETAISSHDFPASLFEAHKPNSRRA